MTALGLGLGIVSLTDCSLLRPYDMAILAWKWGKPLVYYTNHVACIDMANVTTRHGSVYFLAQGANLDRLTR